MLEVNVPFEVAGIRLGMPRYFFNGSDQPDHEGAELADDNCTRAGV
jgi:hypothetical protein